MATMARDQAETLCNDQAGVTWAQETSARMASAHRRSQRRGDGGASGSEPGTEPLRPPVSTSSFHLCRNGLRGTEARPAVPLFFTRCVSSVTHLKQPCTGLENPAPCPQAAYIGETDAGGQRRGAQCHLEGMWGSSRGGTPHFRQVHPDRAEAGVSHFP